MAETTHIPSIPRFTCSAGGMRLHLDGRFVLFIDHEAALAEAESLKAEMLGALNGITDEMELADFDPNDTDTWYGRALAIIAKAEGR
jgi:hypothetical protein